MTYHCCACGSTKIMRAFWRNANQGESSQDTPVLPKKEEFWCPQCIGHVSHACINNGNGICSECGNKIKDC